MTSGAVISLLFIFLRLKLPCKGEGFKGNVTSYGFEVHALPAGASISPMPPSSEIKEGDGKVDYSITEPTLLVPPFANNVLAMVEASNPKLDVKGEYSKWTPKIIKPKKKLIKHVKLHVPKLIPLRTNVVPSNKHLKLRHHMSRGKRLFRQKGKLQLKFLKSGHFIDQGENMKSYRRGVKGRPEKSVSENGRDVYKDDFKSVRFSSGRRSPFLNNQWAGQRLQRREISNEDGLQKNIEALISKSLKKKRGERKQIHDEKKQNEEDVMKKHSKDKRKDILSSPAVTKYVDGMKSKVNHVVSEAKTVLQNTGKIVHGLKKVINGAKLLTEFTDNAVKFAKYFAMEPSNATVDFFEEKAVIAVLEAQKAAAEAKIAAVIARDSAKKAKMMAKRILQDGKSKKAKLMKAVKFAEGQARKAELSARITSFKEKETRKDAVVVDKALRKMIQKANEEADDKEAGDILEDVEQHDNGNETEKGTEGEKNDEDEKPGVSESKSEKQTEEEKQIGNGNMKDKNIEDEKSKEMEKNREDQSGVNGEHEERAERKPDENVNEREEEDLLEKKLLKYSKENNATLSNQRNASKSNSNQGKSTERSEEPGSGSIEAGEQVNLALGPKTVDNKTKGLEASELPELFAGGEDENEVIANDFEKPGYKMPMEAVNKTAASDITNALDKIVEGAITKSKATQNEANDSNGQDSNDFMNITGPSKVNSPGEFQAHSAPKRVAAILEREVKKVDKGPVSLTVTVTRRKLGHANRTSNRSSIGQPRGKNEDFASYDPFNFKSLDTMNKQLNAKHYITDNEDEGRVGLSQNVEIVKDNSIRSFIPNRSIANREKTGAAYTYGPNRLSSSILIPKFHLVPNQNYVRTKKIQRSFVPVAYHLFEPYRYDRLGPSYFPLPQTSPSY